MQGTLTKVKGLSLFTRLAQPLSITNINFPFCNTNLKLEIGRSMTSHSDCIPRFYAMHFLQGMLIGVVDSA
jgi:hypothetical protein